MTEETLFALARQKPSGAERRAFLDSACGDDLHLRDRVERLLAADERSRGILEKPLHPAGESGARTITAPPGPPAEFAPTASPPGYQLLGIVGRGGMGIVYRARDTVMNRYLAVKVLHDRYPANSGAARRFLQEAAITGQLQHPGIPPVHQVGTLPDGKPFLAMKLIKGRTLDELLKQRKDHAEDRGRFLAIFEQVCQAVAYAHAHGVVHRDLKPANVMVGNFGEVQVMDWGLAKLMASRERPRPENDPDITTDPDFVPPSSDIRIAGTSETGAGSILGTPAYMPPEQAIGAVEHIDARSDVFGLGAILCAILTGKPPYAGADAESTRQLAARAKLEGCFTRLNGCGAQPDLIALCQWCLEPEKANRPNDAGELAGAVAGLRSAAEERARNAELDRARAETRAAAKRRMQLALTGVFALVLAAGGAFAWWQDRQSTERKAERERIASEQREAALKQQLDDERRTAEERNRLVRNAETVAALLRDCEAALRADDVARAGTLFEQAESRSKEGGAKHLADQLAQRGADLAMLRELNRIDELIWTIVESKNVGVDGAVIEWRAAFTRYGVLGASSPAEAARRLNASPIRERALAALDLCLIDSRITDVLAISRAATLLATMRLADPDEFRDEVRVAFVAKDVKLLLGFYQHPAATNQPARFAAAMGDILAVPLPLRAKVLDAAWRQKPDDFTVLMTRGTLYRFDKTWKAADGEGRLRAAVAVRPKSVAALNNLALCLYDKGDLDGARAVFLRAIELDRRIATTFTNYGNVLFDEGDLPGATEVYREAVRLDPTFPKARVNLGAALHAAGDLRGAMAEFREAIRLDPKYAGAYYNLGRVLCDLKDFPAAIEALRKAVKFDPKLAHAYFTLGNAYFQLENYREAILAYRAGLRLDSKDAPIHMNLGNALRQVGDLSGAIRSHREAVRLTPRDPVAQQYLAETLFEADDLDGAATAAREAIQLDPKHTEAHKLLGAILAEKGEWAKARPVLERAIQLDPTDASVFNNLGFVLGEMKEWDAAIAAFRMAVKLDASFRPNLDIALQKKAEREKKEGRIAPLPRVKP